MSTKRQFARFCGSNDKATCLPASFPPMFDPPDPALAPRFWQVGALCRAIADSLDARFNPVAVRGEISGFSRASSGHCYFTLKDAQGQIRCAMFRRAASLLDFAPRDGEMVEVRGRLGVYEPRGDLQLIVEALQGREKTAFEVSRILFGEDLPEFDQFLALNETYVQIVELMDIGRVTADEQDGLVRYRPA